MYVMAALDARFMPNIAVQGNMRPMPCTYRAFVRSSKRLLFKMHGLIINHSIQ
jgi:hypothetical protein